MILLTRNLFLQVNPFPMFDFGKFQFESADFLKFCNKMALDQEVTFTAAFEGHAQLIHEKATGSIIMVVQVINWYPDFLQL